MSKADILIVEDDILTAMNISETLEEAGYSCQAVNSGEEALQLLSGMHIRLALLDIHLAGSTDGITVARHIQKDAKIPFIFISGEDGDEVVHSAESTNPFSYLLKPIKLKELLINVRLALKLPKVRLTEDSKLKHDKILMYGRALFVKYRNRFERIELDQIMWIQADNVYTQIVAEQRRLTLSFALKRFEEQVDFPSLKKVNRSQIVNLAKVTALERHRLFIGTEEIRITEQFRDSFLASLSA